jgi:hypothetical protein
VLATLATSRTEGLRADGSSVADALNGGYHLAYLVGAALTVVGLVVALVVLRSPSGEDAAAEEASAAEPVYANAA